MTDAPSHAARVGIVIRTKNRPWFLRRALEDVFAQDYPLWRIHIVNDGGDPRAVDSCVADLPPERRASVSVTHHDEPAGRSAAANAGVRALDLEYTVLHDDDDLWDRTFLSTTTSWLDGNASAHGVVVRTDIVYETARDGGYVEVDRSKFWPQITTFTYSELLQTNRAVPIAVLYRTALHHTVGYYRDDLHAVEDWDFYLRATLEGPFGLIDGRPLAFWMQRVGVDGEEGNSVFALSTEHDRYDRLVRDEALRDFVRAHGAGLPLYLSRYIQDEVDRQLTARQGPVGLVLDRARAWRHRRRQG